MLLSKVQNPLNIEKHFCSYIEQTKYRLSFVPSYPLHWKCPTKADMLNVEFLDYGIIGW